VSRNAEKHGLASAWSRPPELEKELLKRAIAIASPCQDGVEVLSLAFEVAEADADLHWVRSARKALLAAAFERAQTRFRESLHRSLFSRDALLGEEVHDPNELSAFERYETRALRRRRTAVRRFDQKCALGGPYGTPQG